MVLIRYTLVLPTPGGSGEILVAFTSRRAGLAFGDDVQARLERIVRSPSESARHVERARILLNYAAGKSVSAIARELRPAEGGTVHRQGSATGRAVGAGGPAAQGASRDHPGRGACVGGVAGLRQAERPGLPGGTVDDPVTGDHGAHCEGGSPESGKLHGVEDPGGSQAAAAQDRVWRNAIRIDQKCWCWLRRTGREFQALCRPKAYTGRDYEYQRWLIERLGAGSSWPSCSSWTGPCSTGTCDQRLASSHPSTAPGERGPLARDAGGDQAGTSSKLPGGVQVDLQDGRDFGCLDTDMVFWNRQALFEYGGH